MSMLYVSGVFSFNTQNFNVKIVRKAFDGINQKSPVEEIKFSPATTD